MKRMEKTAINAVPIKRIMLSNIFETDPMPTMSESKRREDTLHGPV